MEEQGGITRRKMITRLGVTGVALLGSSTGFATKKKTGTYDDQKLEEILETNTPNPLLRAIATVAEGLRANGSTAGFIGEL